MSRILLLAFAGSRNLGDELIVRSVAGMLRAALPGARIDLPSVSVGAPPADGVVPFGRWNVVRWLASLLRCDAFVLGGGGILQDWTSAWNCVYFLLPTTVASLLRKPVFVFAVGVGPLRRRWLRTWTGWLLRRAAGVTVRDDASKTLLAECGVPRSSVAIVADPAFAGVRDRLAALSPRRADVPHVCCSLRHEVVPDAPFSRGTMSEPPPWLDEVAAALDVIAAGGRRIAFVPAWPGRDDDVHEHVVARMERPDAAVLVDPGGELDAILSWIAGADCVLAMRLHVLVAAAVAHRPLVGLVYDDKVASCMQALRRGDHAMALQDVTRDGLVAALRLAMEAGPPEHDVVEKLDADARHAAALFAAVLFDKSMRAGDRT